MSGHAVSRETRERLAIFETELRRWQKAVNLVAPASLAAFAERHVLDSLQLLPLGEARSGTWVDLGSGGGMPGLVIAAAEPARPVILIESDSRKAAFLRHVASRMAVAVRVIDARIEDALVNLTDDVGVVSARALAPLVDLLGYAQPLLARGAVGLFPKGRSFATELTVARERWHFDVDVLPSATDSAARILRIRHLAPPVPDDGSVTR